MRTIIFALWLPAACVGFFILKRDPKVLAQDWSHERITEEAVLNVVRRFFEDHPPFGLKPQQGRYASSLTIDQLWEKYYGVAEPNSLSFKQAVKEIVRGMETFARNAFLQPQFTFNNDKILEGARELRSLDASLRSVLGSTAPAYGTGRALLGAYFYTLQSFYSNSNWANIYGAAVCTELGAHSFSPASRLKPPPQGLDMCTSCPPNLRPGDRSCEQNLLNRAFVTSGYLPHFGLGKPPAKMRWGRDEGACGHGGSTDASRNTPATGGINKESTDPAHAPHWFLHAQAARGAMLHTERFLDKSNGLRGLLKEKTFRTLFGITYDANTKPNPNKPTQQVFPKYSLGFAIDTTGSMSSEIAVVKTAIAKLINDMSLRAPEDRPDTYVLSLFNDPLVPLELTTKDPKVVLQHVNAITVRGGGDCEEMAMTGLRAALELMHATPATSGRPSTLLLFTDAPPKDYCKAQEVLTLARRKGIKVIDFNGTRPDCPHSGSACVEGVRTSRTGRAAHPFLPPAPPAVPLPQAVSYAIDPNSILGSLARQTGGGVLQVGPGSSLAQVLNKVIAEAVKAAPPARTAANSLPLMTLLLPASARRTVRVVVDTSVRDMLITAAAPNPQTLNIVVRNPKGAVEKEDIKRVIYEKSRVAATVWVMSAAIQTGEWSIEFTTTAETRVTVLADTHVSFLYEVKDKNLQPLQGLAVQGESYTLELEVAGARSTGKMTSLQLHRADGSLVSSHVISLIKPSLPEYYSTTLVLPAETPLTVRMVGEDAFGNPLVRESGAALHLSTVDVKLIRNRFSGVNPAPGQVYKFQVQLNNTGARNTFHISATSKLFTQTATPSVTTLNQNEDALVDIEVHVPLKSGGKLDSVKVRVTDAKGTQLNLLQHQLLVTLPPVVVSSKPPTCRTSDVNITCSSDVRPFCELSNWRVQFNGGDVDDGIIQVFAISATNYSSLPQVNWTSSSRQVQVDARASCCHLDIRMVLTDVAGQSALCSYTRAPLPQPSFTSGVTHAATTTAQLFIAETSVAGKKSSVGPSPLVLGIGVSCGVLLIIAAIVGAMLLRNWRISKQKISDSQQQLQGAKQRPSASVTLHS